MKACTVFEVLFPLMNKVFFGSSISLGYLLRMRLTLLMDLGYFFIVD